MTDVDTYLLKQINSLLWWKSDEKLQNQIQIEKWEEAQKEERIRQNILKFP